MTIEVQIGDVHYRQRLGDPRTVEMQEWPGARWTIVAVFRYAADAQAFVMRLGRGDAEPDVVSV